MNLFKSKEDQVLGLLHGVLGELRGIRIALQNIALKEAALGAPPPTQPDESDFLAQSDADLALLEKLGQVRQGPGADEVDLLAEAELLKEETQPAAAATWPVHPEGSFLPRFPRR